MEILKKIYTFRLAAKKDSKAIMLFIKKFWIDNHILGQNKKFFNYQYKNKSKYNFLIAINKKNSNIDAIQGFIPYTKKIQNGHICGSVTLVRPGIKIPYLGIWVMKKMLEITKPKTYCGIGTNPKTMKPLLERFFSRITGKMNHFYFLNENKSKFSIAKVEKKKKKKFEKNKIHIIELKEFSELKKFFNFNKKYKYLPYKDKWYLKKRYFEHPFFKYKFFLLDREYLLVGKEKFYRNSKILTYVDYVGEMKLLKNLGCLTNDLILKNNYEYVDMLCNKDISKILKVSGFSKKSFKDKNIIPIYFEPFVRKNVEIIYEMDQDKIYFKADADQDTPRLSNLYKKKLQH